jgi:hypothetical protein
LCHSCSQALLWSKKPQNILSNRNMFVYLFLVFLLGICMVLVRWCTVPSPDYFKIGNGALHQWLTPAILS